YDDRQAIVPARLAHRARLGAEPSCKLPVRQRAAARDLAERLPQPALELCPLDEQRQVEPHIGIVTVALQLPRGALGERCAWCLYLDIGWQIADAAHALLANADRYTHLWKLNDRVVHKCLRPGFSPM